MDRIMAVALGSFIFGLVVVVMTSSQGIYGFVTDVLVGVIGAIPPAALLWASTYWSLSLFALLAFPLSFAAYVLCDIARASPASDILHWAHESALWCIPYGLIRFLICIMGSSFEGESSQLEHHS